MKLLKNIGWEFRKLRNKIYYAFHKLNPDALKYKDMEICEPWSNLFFEHDSNIIAWYSCTSYRYVNCIGSRNNKWWNDENSLVQAFACMIIKGEYHYPNHLHNYDIAPFASFFFDTKKGLVDVINILYKFRIDEKESSTQLGLQK